MKTLTGRDLLPFLSLIRTDTPGFLLECSRRFGDLVCFAIGGPKVFFVNHPDWIRQILQDHHKSYSKDTIQYNTLATITGRGLLTSDGNDWLKHRRLEQPAFTRPRLAMLDQVVLPATQAALTRWEAHRQTEGLIDIDQEMMSLTLEVVGKALFGIDLRQDAPRLTHAVLTALDHVIYKVQNLVTPPAWVPTPRNRAFKIALKQLDEAVQEIIDQRRKTGQKTDDLLSMLLFARDEETGSGLSDQQIRDEVITILIAGHETVASALTWSWYLLASHPEQWQRLRSEIIDVLGSQLPGTADLSNLPYTNQVFSEALRLYPPAWLITRKAIEEDKLGEQVIPAGSLIVMSPYVIHRHPEFWEQPEQFNPERFAESNEKSWPRYAYIPFGGGPRLCIGNNFALIEGALILAAVTQRYRLELVSPHPIHADPLVTLRPHAGLPMRLIPVE